METQNDDIAAVLAVDPWSLQATGVTSSAGDTSRLCLVTEPDDEGERDALGLRPTRPWFCGLNQSETLVATTYSATSPSPWPGPTCTGSLALICTTSDNVLLITLQLKY
ncbi:uncharacterized protein LOC108666319 [Hyalella azteca]|uniref:Uncharacterized protein LOC108666319 n=1 Tax=Hyalella azteca TaxID=294128 RepID=A0A8B7N5S0_HYAAZ|nr:uncharacterized protein LOC108666319 [Hyalella azteca]